MAARSYSPRHAAVPGPSSTRRTATVLATSVGVAAVAGTAFAGPAEASAAHHTVWDRVASCESTQRWHIATGNGYYGGLQFSSSTWRAYGGGKYAGRADRATRGEQIQVARRVLRSQGRNAWPVCGPRAGLTKSSGHATRAKLPAHAGDGMTSGVGARRVTTHVTSTHRPKPKSRSSHGGHYTVRRGDTLSGIAQRHHVHGGWHALYRANRNHLHNPNVLHIGQHLLLP